MGEFPPTQFTSEVCAFISPTIITPYYSLIPLLLPKSTATHREPAQRHSSESLHVSVVHLATQTTYECYRGHLANILGIPR